MHDHDVLSQLAAAAGAAGAEPPLTLGGPAGAGWPPLAALIASRICHDLISPVGAVCNGVELIEQFGASGAGEMALIGDSARGAAALLQLFRTGFGSGGNDMEYGLDQLRKMLDARHKDDRVELVWAAPPGAASTRLGARLGALGAMGGAAALPRGGTLRIESDGPRALRVQAEGPMMRLEPSVPAWLRGEAGERPPEARDAHWAAAWAFAADGGAELGYHADEGRMSLTIALPASAA